MREISFDLTKYKDIKGELILEIPKYRDKLKLIKECNFKVSNEGTVNISADAIDSMIKLIDMTEKYFKKINLKCGKIEVKNFEDMESHPEFDSLISEAATAILNSGRLGK